MSSLNKQLFFVMAMLMLCGQAYATNGYFTTSPSVVHKGMAGAGVAYPEGLMATGQNPAAAIFIEDGMSASVSNFRPDRKFTVTGNSSQLVPAGAMPLTPGTVKSDSGSFIIPGFSFNMHMGETTAFNLLIQANGGMNTDYPSTVFPGSSSPTGVDLSQLFVVPTYARRVNDSTSWGISPIFAFQRFEMKGLETFATAAASSNPNHVTNHGHDYSLGVGVRFGFLKYLNDKWNVGLTWQPKISMTHFDSYKGLFAEGGKFDIPETYNLGFAFLATDKLTWLFDVQRINYSDARAIGNEFATGGLLGTNNGRGFGWDDMTIFKLGLEWKRDEKITYRFGYSTGDQPVGSNEVLFNILAPGIIEDHVSLGFTRHISDEKDIDFAITRSLSSSVSGPNPMYPSQTIGLEMDQWEFSVAYNIKM